MMHALLYKHLALTALVVLPRAKPTLKPQQSLQHLYIYGRIVAFINDCNYLYLMVKLLL